jgi:hypothetical protein
MPCPIIELDLDILLFGEAKGETISVNEVR